MILCPSCGQPACCSHMVKKQKACCCCLLKEMKAKKAITNKKYQTSHSDQITAFQAKWRAKQREGKPIKVKPPKPIKIVKVKKEEVYKEADYVCLSCGEKFKSTKHPMDIVCVTCGDIHVNNYLPK